MGKYRERAKHERTCTVCGAVFLASRADANFCSPKCRQAGKRKATGRSDKRPATWVAPNRPAPPTWDRRSLTPGENVWLAGRYERYVVVSVGYSTRRGDWQATVRQAGTMLERTVPLGRVFGAREDALNHMV